MPIASGSPVAAVARASRDVLIGVGLTTTQGGASVDTLYMNYIAARGLQNDPGLAVGQRAAAPLLALRANNTGQAPANAEQFFGGTGTGEWHPTSFSATGQPLPMVAAYIRDIQPFTLRDASQFRQEPPPHLASGKYVDEYSEVKALSSLTGSSRRPSQTRQVHVHDDEHVRAPNDRPDTAESPRVLEILGCGGRRCGRAHLRGHSFPLSR